jgi:threonine dehydratase
MLPFDEILTAQENIRPYLIQTPLIRCTPLEKELKLKGRLFLKCEHMQQTGSFKPRGAFNALLQLSSQEKKHGVVSRSSGNFAQGLAYAGNTLHIPITLIIPSNAPKIKKDAAAKWDARIFFSDLGHAEQQAKALEISQEEKLTLLSPFDHLKVIAGAGTLALEIWEHLPTISQYFCPIGGGGLMAGSSAAFKALNPAIETTGIEPQGANDYFLSRQAGLRQRLAKVDTIADGLRAPQVGELNWPILQKNVDKLALVSDQEIINAVRYLHEKMGMVIEPSGAAAFAALLNHPEKIKPGADAVCLLSGGNVDRAIFDKWIHSS